MITKDFIESQRELIERKIGELQREVRESGKYEDTGSTSEDEAYEFERFEEKAAIGKDASKELIELKAALKRIEENKYGICEKCKGPIELSRLKAFPQARFCASDK